MCALIFLFAYTIYVASALVAGTSVFTTLFPDISPKIAMFAFLLIIVAYTFFGGFAAVCWTDFFQGLLMMAALMLVPIVVYFGHSELLDPTALETAYEYTDAATGAVTQCAFGGGIFNASWQDIVSGLGWGLGYFGMPQVLLRFMAIRKGSELKRSRRIATVWVLISLTAAVTIGVIGRYILPTDPALATQSGAENVFAQLAKLLFHPVVAGVIMAGILAATISSSDSYLLIAASAVSKNLFEGIVKKDATDKQVMRVSRIVLVVITLIGMGIAWNENSIIFRIVSFAGAGFGATFGPIILFSLFWKRTNRAGAIAGMVSGGVMVFVWKLLLKPMGGVFGIYELLPAFLISCIFIVVVSLCTAKPSAEIEEEFEKVRNYSEA